MTSSRLIAIVSHITIVGWIVAFVMYQNDKSDYAKFYLRQSLGIYLIMISAYFLGIFGRLVSTLGLILLIVSLVDATKDRKSPSPFIGQYFQQIFTFIN